MAGKKFGGKVAEAADQVKAAMGEAVIANQFSTKYPNAKGLNIELNRQSGIAEAGPADIPNMSQESRDRMKQAPYKDQKFAQETRWDEMLRKVR